MLTADDNFQGALIAPRGSAEGVYVRNKSGDFRDVVEEDGAAVLAVEDFVHDSASPVLDVALVGPEEPAMPADEDWDAVMQAF